MDNSEIEYKISGPAQAALLAFAATTSGDSVAGWMGNYNQQGKLMGATDAREHGQITMLRRLELKCVVPLPPSTSMLSSGKLNYDTIEPWSKAHEPLLNILSIDPSASKKKMISKSLVGLVSLKRGAQNITKPTVKDKILCREFFNYLKKDEDSESAPNLANPSKNIQFVYTLVKTSYGSSDLSSHRVSIAHFRVEEVTLNLFSNESEKHSVLKFHPILIKVANLGDAPAPVYFQQNSGDLTGNRNKNDKPLLHLIDSSNEMNVMGKVGKAQREYHRLLSDTMEEKLIVENDIKRLEEEIKTLEATQVTEMNCSNVFESSNIVTTDNQPCKLEVESSQSCIKKEVSFEGEKENGPKTPHVSFCENDIKNELTEKNLITPKKEYSTLNLPEHDVGPSTRSRSKSPRSASNTPRK